MDTTDFNQGELILVSDGCRDCRALEYIKAKAQTHPWIHLVELAQPGGYGKANNIGVQYSAGNVLVFLNSDVFPKKNSVNTLVEYIIQHQPEVGAAQGLLIYPQTGLVQSTGHLFMGYHNAHIYSGCEYANPLVQRGGCRQALTTAYTAIPKHVFEKMSGFDEVYYNAYEGMELTLKISLSGRRCMYYPEAVAFHAVGGSRANMNYDDSIPGHIFWHRWKDQIRDDIHEYLSTQITVQMKEEIYFFLQGSSISEWQTTLQKVGLRVSECFELPSRFCHKIDLYRDLPRAALDSPAPYLFTVNELSCIAGNHNWGEVRHNYHDIVMDTHGIICPLMVVLGLN